MQNFDDPFTHQPPYPQRGSLHYDNSTGKLTSPHAQNLARMHAEVSSKSEAARILGSSTSAAKASSSAKNGAQGGRPTGS